MGELTQAHNLHPYRPCTCWAVGEGTLGGADPGLAPSPCRLYDIYWTQDMEEQLHALEEARPPLRVIC